MEIIVSNININRKIKQDFNHNCYLSWENKRHIYVFKDPTYRALRIMNTIYKLTTTKWTHFTNVK
jgi:hypothetical protein